MAFVHFKWEPKFLASESAFDILIISNRGVEQPGSSSGS